MSDCFIKIPIGTDTVFSINTDGTYTITTEAANASGYDRETIAIEGSCLLQCYSNGYANIISLNDLLQLRKNYSYSHGIYNNTTLQLCGICTRADFIVVLFEKTAKKHLSIAPVSELNLHSMLGLKGDNVVKTPFEVIQEWHILPSQYGKEVEKIVSICSRSGYIDIDNQDCSNELLWLNNNVFKSASIETLPALKKYLKNQRKPWTRMNWISLTLLVPVMK